MQDPTEPLPILGRIPTWNANEQTPLHEWLSSESQLSPDILLQEIEAGNCLLLLDGLDELGNLRIEKGENEQEIRYDPRQRFIKILPTNNKIVLTSRIADYEKLGESIALNGAVTLHALTDEQIKDYLSATPETFELWNALQKQPELLKVARNPLLLSLFAFAFRDLPDNMRNLKDLNTAELRDAIFEEYMKKRYEHEEEKYKKRGDVPPVTLEIIKNTLGYIACKLVFSYSYSFRRQNNLFSFRDISKALEFFYIGYYGDEKPLARLWISINSFEYPLAFYFIQLHFINFYDESMYQYSWEKLLKLRLSQDSDSVIKFLKIIGETSFYFKHLLLRDYFARQFAVANLDNLRAYKDEPIIAEEIIGGINPAFVLGTLKDFRTLPRLIELAYEESNSRIIRGQIAEALGEFDCVESHSALLELLKAKESFVRNKAIIGISKLGKAEDIDIMIHGLHINQGLVSSRAFHALQRLATPEALEAIRKWKEENNYQD